MKTSRLLAAGLVAATLVFLGCPQPTESDSDSASHEDATVYGTVGGYVKDAFGFPLANVTVSANTGSNSRDVVHAMTDSKGWFEIKNLISGDHTLVVGSSAVGATVRTTTRTVTVHVPGMDELRDASELPGQVASAAREIVEQPTSMIKEVDGNYFVNIDIGNDEEDDVFVVYPFNATISGIAKIKTSENDADSLAGFPGAGYVAVADFTDWNEGQPLLFTGTVDGATGAFSIANVPAVGTVMSGQAIELRLDNSSVVADTTGDASTATSPSGITDGILRASETRNLGTHYFVAAIAPKIISFSPAPGSYSTVKFDPGTAAARTPLVFTFNKGMNPALGTLTIKDDDLSTPDDYVFAGVWSAGNTVFTATPDEMFEYGETLAVSFAGFESADGVPYAGGPFSFVVRDALKLLDSNTWTAYGNNINTLEFPIDGDVVLTFNSPIVVKDAASNYLSLGGAKVPATFTASGSTLTISPAADLLNNTAYVVNYKVGGDLFNLQDVVSSTTLGFTTEKKTVALAAPTASFDNPRNLILHTTTRDSALFEHGDATFYITYTIVPDAEEYYLQYKLSTASAWTTYGTALAAPTAATPVYPTYMTSTNYTNLVTLANLAGATIVDGLASGEIFDFRILAKTADGRYESTSATLQMKDQIAPNNTTRTVTTALVSGSPNNAANAVAGYAVYTVALSGTEPLADLSTSDVTPPANATVYSVGRNASGVVEFVLQVAASQDVSGGTLTIVLRDKAGNTYDNDNAAGGITNFSFNL